MNKSYKHQEGLTLITFVLLMAMIGFLVMIGLKVGPIYMNHSKVVHALESVKNRPDIIDQSKQGVWLALNKQFGMNYVENVTKKDVKITSRPGYLKIHIRYYVKQPFIDTLSIWVDFDNSVEVGSQ